MAGANRRTGLGHWMKAIDQYMREYQRLNHSATEADLADVRSDMEKLIQV